MNFKAIAAMSQNRVIGCGSKIPWHLPEDFRWFKKMTTGQIMVMGRKTFQGIGRPLPDRHTIVLSRRFKTGNEIIGQEELFRTGTCEVANGINKISHLHKGKNIFICGGAQIYEQALPLCSDLYLTVVKRVVKGDAFFPKFEDKFELADEILDCEDFKILHFRNLKF